MEQKGKIQWMDVWLHSNRKAPNYYEMYLGGGHNKYERTTVSAFPVTMADNDDLSSASGHFGFFISWFGLYGKYEDSHDETRITWDALAQIRLLGTSDQGSNLTLFYGVRNNEFAGDEVMHQQVGGALTFYLLNAWAIQGRYQHLLTETSDQGLEIDGYRFEATTWLEWGALRAYGTWYHEPRESTDVTGNLSLTRREGFEVGLRFYLDFKK